MKKIVIALLLVFIVIQFFHPEKNTSTAIGVNDITKKYSVPEDVYVLLKTSCYDCHSNNTVYPKYASLQPLSWWINHHIDEGKDELNFSEFTAYPIRRQYKKFEEIIKQIKENEMPLASYTIIHKNAVLSETQKKSIINWATLLVDSIKTNFPADSLKKK